MKKNMKGETLQDCEVYIGRKVANSHWDLPKSDWNSPFFVRSDNAGEALGKYEDYLREERPDLMARLGELDGKTLGCWCKPRPCHGDVLVRLVEENKFAGTKADIKNSGLRIISDTNVWSISKAWQWANDPLWLAHATRLGDTNVFYFWPETFFALRACIGHGPDYWIVYTNDDVPIYVVGQYRGKQPLGPFWRSDLVIHKGLSRTEKALLKFAKALQRYIEMGPHDLEASTVISRTYFDLHRKIVRKCGQVLGVDMEDHDLTKSRLVQVALGYWWHYAGERVKELLELAKAAVTMGHCERENHHPEFETAQNGDVDMYKLFIDRVSVHLQKDPRDALRGWDVKDVFVPPQYKNFWNEFRDSYGYIDLYEKVFNPEAGVCE